MQIKDNYTFELKEVLNYIEETLINEFPTYLITPEYLLLSIMDNKTCHANILLENMLMSSRLEKLRETYTAILGEHTNRSAKVAKNKLKYSERFDEILEWAEKEAKKEDSQNVGTEHILLGIINPENENAIMKVLESVGLKYEFMVTKCTPKPLKDNEPKKVNLGISKSSSVLGKGVDISFIGSTIGTDAIEAYTTDINNLIINGDVDSTIGRDSLIDEIISTMARRKKNNVILVGENGCGLTQIVYGLAERIINGTVPEFLSDKTIVKLDSMALVSGTNFRGMFEERVNKLFNQLKENSNYILFLDDMHTFLSGREKDKDTDLSGAIGGLLSDGTVSVIGTTSFKQYRNAIENHPQVSRKLRKITVEPVSQEVAFMIIRSNKERYEKHHSVTYSDESIMKAVELAGKYITDRTLPDSALDIIDMCGASYSVTRTMSEKELAARKRLGEIFDEEVLNAKTRDYKSIERLDNEKKEIEKQLKEDTGDEPESVEETKDRVITPNDIMETVAMITGLPISKLSSTEKERMLNIDKVLKESVIGQDDAVDAVCKVIKRNRVGLGDKTKTMANILMVGPSGCGKTLIAKKLAEQIFGDENNLVRIDMSEYSEKNSVSKLTGAAPGYIGYDNGGQLTEAVKRKQHCVLLLDEIEKADEEVYNVFLQLMDDARLTDSSGQIVSFKNVIVLMTSNIGAKQAEELGGGLGFVSNSEDNKRSIIDKQLKRKFTPEFLNRIDKIVHFNQLTDENLKNIVKLELEKLRKRIVNIGYDIIFDETIINHIHGLSTKEKKYGARPIIRIIQDSIEDPITEELLSRDYPSGHVFKVFYSDGVKINDNR